MKSFEDLEKEEIYNYLRGEPLEICKLDQCMYGLTDAATGLYHRKSTGMLLSSKCMKEQLSNLCDQSHGHVPLEGGTLTKQSQQWPLLV